MHELGNVRGGNFSPRRTLFRERERNTGRASYRSLKIIQEVLAEEISERCRLDAEVRDKPRDPGHR